MTCACDWGSPPLDPHMGPNPHPLAKIHGYSHGACHKWLVSELFHTISGLRQTFFRFLSNWLLTIDKRKNDKIPPMVASWTHNCMVTQLSPTSSESFLGLCVLYMGHFFDVLWEPLLSLQKEIDSPTSNFKQEGSYHARVIWYETTIRAKAISHIRNWTKRIDFFYVHSQYINYNLVLCWLFLISKLINIYYANHFASKDSNVLFNYEIWFPNYFASYFSSNFDITGWAQSVRM